MISFNMLAKILNVKVKVYKIESGINSNFQTTLLFKFKNHFFFQERLYAKNIIVIINISRDFFHYFGCFDLF